ncbi:MAG TPA: DUF4160 domain-containing protein [Longimicrobium sp.]|jgi:hypothetical protein|nr:DUF4160 domain-containing protein [Longimicrobium sp.]
MPTVLTVGGFAFSFFPDDHEPAHVHVRYAGKKCRIVLETLKLSKSTMNTSDEASALRLVSVHREELMLAWAESKLNRGGEG